VRTIFNQVFCYDEAKAYYNMDTSLKQAIIESAGQFVHDSDVEIKDITR
jgi:hypothetical protein